MPTPDQMLKLTSQEQVPEKEVVIRFIEPNAPYWQHEEARFTAKDADLFIKAGKAVYVKDVPPVPVKKAA